MAESRRRLKAGTVALVGAGPGDPGLLTLRGLERLSAADAVVYDALVNPELLKLAPAAARFLRAADQAAVNRLLVRLARQGKKVVRLKGGDPFVFGRGGEEASSLKKAGVRFEVVPGVTAGIAAPAYAGIPVTDRRAASAVLFVTVHETPGRAKAAVAWDAVARLDATLVLFMGVGNLARVARALRSAGKPGRTPCSVIEWGTTSRQRVARGTLATIARAAKQKGIRAPAVTVVGEVNRLSKEIAWLAKSPLAGKTVLVTRAAAQASALRDELEKRGAEVVEFPVIRIAPPADWGPLDRALEEAGAFDWIVFTSVNGAEAVLGRLARLGKDARLFSGARLAAIGEATARRLEEKGLRPDLVPPRFTSEELFRMLKAKGEIRGRRFLLARADIAPEILARSLEAEGGRVTEVKVYRTLPVRDPRSRRHVRRWMREKKIDYVTFTSASTVRNFFRAFPEWSGRKRRRLARFVSIGPVTSRELSRHGHRPYRQAREHTIAGLADALAGKNR